MIVKCPHCGRKYNLKPEAAGRQATCKQCDRKFVIRGDDDTFPLQAESAPPAVPTMTPVTRVRPPQPAEVAVAATVQHNTVIVQTPSRFGASLGISALVLGIVAFIICWIPLVNMLGMPLSALGLLLGVVGAIVALVRHGSGIGYAIAGTAICGVALTVALSINLALFATAKAAADVLAKPPTVGVVAANAPVPVSSAGTLGSVVAPPDEAVVEKSPPPDEGWVEAQSPVLLGDVCLTIDRVTVGKLILRNRITNEASQISKDELLSISLTIQNTSQNRKIDYRSWGQDVPFADNCELSDNFGNRYRSTHFTPLSVPEGSVVSGSLYPGKQVSDVIAFERPIPTAEQLFLELPGSNVGQSGAVFRIKIPVSMIGQGTPAPTTSEPAEAESHLGERIPSNEDPRKGMPVSDQRGAPKTPSANDQAEADELPEPEKSDEEQERSKRSSTSSDNDKAAHRKLEASIQAIKMMLKQKEYKRAADAIERALVRSKGTDLEDDVQALQKEMDALRK